MHDSFARQQVMEMLGVSMTRCEPGVVELQMRHRGDLTQQHGFIHAGIIATVMDSACGYAAFTLMPADASVLTVEYKINLLAPAKGELLIARAAVKRAGKIITVCTADAFMDNADELKPVAIMLGTIMCLHERSDR